MQGNVRGLYLMRLIHIYHEHFFYWERIYSINKMHAKHILFIVGYSSNALIKCIKSGDILTQLIKEVSCKGRVTQEYTRRILVSLRVLVRLGGLWWEVIGISWVG